MSPAAEPGAVSKAAAPLCRAAAKLTMEQHAGIAAALAEGLPRAEVLAQERMAEGAYRSADVVWKQRLVEDARGPAEPAFGTVAVFELPKSLVLPFAPAPSRPSGSPAPAVAAAPSASPPAPAAPSPVSPASPNAPPRLSPLDHATLCAEIALRPAKATEALGRCGLDSASKAALDAYFNALRAERPAADAAWNKTYRESYARLILSAWKGPGSR
ncbi:MAG: hypothetical protein FJ104_14510 [Deltaproteobacteria bacterium]|nr:hypothetical protein [Deltaproteobacteria bacterium]